MRHQEVKMVYSYFPGCTLKTKAKDLDRYGRESAKALGFELKRLKTGSAAAVYIRWEQMRLPANFLLFVH